jgi:hypothetical protein
MKLVFLTYLEDDEDLVTRQLEASGVPVFSQLPLEGHGTGARGWYGEVAPYRSRMVFSVLPDEDAARLLEAVEGWPTGQDAQHPVRQAGAGS